MENEKITIQHRLFEGRYFYSFDIHRVVCLTLMVFAGFGLPLPYFELVRPFLNAATGIMFTLYGFIVLRDGADLRKNIKHAAKAFFIMLAVYIPLTIGYQWLMYGQPFKYFTKRGLFNFVVLNYWEPTIGSTIWYVQSALYALIILWLLRKLKRFDWVLCVVLFVGSILVGELAALTGIKFGVYNYIPGNFLTRTIPYMLLGRLIYTHFRKIRKRTPALGTICFIAGLVLSIAEYFALLVIGKLGYSNHFAGFILISFGVCLMAIKHPNGGKLNKFAIYAKRMYKPIYYIYNPIGCLLPILALMLCRTTMQYSICLAFVGLATALICFFGTFLFAKRYYKKHPDALAAEQAKMRKKESMASEDILESNAASISDELPESGLELDDITTTKEISNDETEI